MTNNNKEKLMMENRGEVNLSLKAKRVIDKAVDIYANVLIFTLLSLTAYSFIRLILALF